MVPPWHLDVGRHHTDPRLALTAPLAPVIAAFALEKFCAAVLLTDYLKIPTFKAFELHHL